MQCSIINKKYCHEWEGSVTYKYVGCSLDTGFIVHLALTTRVITVYSMALSPIHNITGYSLLPLQTQSIVCL
jgi:hypothetical protein